MTQIGTVELLAKINTDDYKRGAKEIDRTNDEIERSAGKASKSIGSSFSNEAKLATTAIVAMGIAAVYTFVKSASEIQSLRASFESLTGNVDDTNKVMSTLYDLSRKTAFENKDIQTAGRSYLAAGVSVEDLQNILRDTADIAGATGANLAQLTLPLTQAIARGKLQTQDFYQIMNSGAGALRKPLEDIAGQKGFGSINEAMEAGVITSGDLLSAMNTAASEGGFAFQGAIKQADTFNGRVSNLRESITLLGLDILGVDAITGQIDPGGAFAQMSNAIGAATGFLSEHGGMLKQVFAVITFLLIPALTVLGVQALQAGARIGAGILLAMGPIGLILAAVFAAAFLIVKNWDWIRDTAISVWNNIGSFVSSTVQKIQNAVGGVLNWIRSNWPMLLAILTGPIGLAVYAIVSNIDRIRQTFANVFNGIVGFIRGIDWSDIGRAIIMGIGSGIAGMGGWLAQRAKDAVGAAKDALKSFLGIHSPSTVMRDEIGKMLGAGIAVGIDQSTKGVVTAAKHTSSAIMGGFGDLSAGYSLNGTTSLTSSSALSDGLGTNNSREYNIGTINLASDVDAEQFIRKLTGDTELTFNGLTPRQAYM